MMPRSLIKAALLLVPVSISVRASVLEVGPGEAHQTIQSAIDAASPGDVVLVSPGLYPENVVVNKAPLVLRGARAGVDACGRVGAVPDASVESVIAPSAGVAVSLESGDGPVEIAGFTLVSPAPAGAGVVSNEAAATPGLILRENHVRVSAGSTGSAVWLNSSAEDATFERNDFLAAAGTVQGIFLDGGDSFDGFHFINNDLRRVGGGGGTGLFVDGNRNVGPSAARASRIAGNRFAGHALGFNGGKRALEAVVLEDNDFEGNLGGFAGGPKDCEFRGNRWTDNAFYGLRLTSFGATGPDFGAVGNEIVDNRFSHNGTDPAGFGDLRVDDQAAGHVSSTRVEDNQFGSSVGVHQDDPHEGLDASYNYWGDPSGPAGVGPGGGAAISGVGAVSYVPWFRDEVLTALDFGSEPIEGEVVLEDGQRIEGDRLVLGDGGSLVVGEGGLVEVGTLEIRGGAVLRIPGGRVAAGSIQLDTSGWVDVESGSLSFEPLAGALPHVIDGTFRIYNSFGSIEIGGNTTFSGSTLAVISEIHIANGATLTVLGSLIFDGCTIDSPGGFNILVNPGAELEMVRCDVTGANVLLVGSDFLLRDNFFRNSLTTVFSTVTSGTIVHNVFEDGPGSLNILPGAGVTTSIEGWGNVTSAGDVINQLGFQFQAPGDPTRTLDAAGNLFVQPGDPVVAELGIAHLVDKAQAVELLAGFSSTHLAYDGLVPSTTWGNGLYESMSTSGAVGLVDSAIGLGFSQPDPDGTMVDAVVADFAWVAQPAEGLTRIHFRRRTTSDLPLIDTRITASTSGIPYFRHWPFTANSGNLTIDGTMPEFGPTVGVEQIRDGVPIDLLTSGVVTRQGTVKVVFESRDLLAGIDDGDAEVNFAGISGSLPATLVSTTPATSGGESYTRYEFELTVGATTPNGIYNVDASVMDRSGNLATLAIGAVEILKNQVTGIVEPQGLVSSALTRDVTFVATDSTGAVLGTWTTAIDFIGGAGTFLLEEVPAGTANLSAKMAWNLRVRLPVAFDAQGQAVVDFTGPAQLRGGDLNGDNLVILTDYSLMAATFPAVATVPDITGDGIVNLTDYSILQSNWLTAGDPE